MAIALGRLRLTNLIIFSIQMIHLIDMENVENFEIITQWLTLGSALYATY